MPPREEDPIRTATEDGSRKLVLVAVPIREAMEAGLLSAGFQLMKAWEMSPAKEEQVELRQLVTAMLCRGFTVVDADLIGRFPRLRCIVTTSIGVDNIDVEQCRRRGIAVGNAGPAFVADAADCTIGLLIDVLRRISFSRRTAMKEGFRSFRRRRVLGSQVGGKRVGIVGLGNIGSAVAKRLLAFDCTVSYTSRSKKHDVCFPFYSNTMELAAANDVLILTCALTNETKHIVNKHVLSALGKNGIIINVGRGALIDEKELVRSLVEAEIGGAGLDVFEDEPHVPKELFDMDNVVLSPHSAVLTHESLQDVCDITVGNLQAFFANKPLLSEVK